eukprot:gene57821-77165_t
MKRPMILNGKESYLVLGSQRLSTKTFYLLNSLQE